MQCRRSDALLEMSAKPLYRFMNLLLAQVGCARYVLENHCRSAAEVKPLARLMSLGNSPVTDELEGLTNQAAALLAVVAEEELGNTQFEKWLCDSLSQQQVMMYEMMAKPGARASLARGRCLSQAEYANEIKAHMASVGADAAVDGGGPGGGGVEAWG